MTISLVFSSIIYQVSVSELERGLRRTPRILMEQNGPNFSASILNRLTTERIEAYEQARSRILVRLAVINSLILIGGGVLSYYLAVRTLRPIQKAHQSLERFTADASHELRTPITAMRTEIEVALMNPNLGLAAAKKQLRSNVEELENLTALAEGLLQLAHQDKKQIVKTTVKVYTLLETARQRVLPAATKKSIQITTTAKAKILLQADEMSITEALVILLDNAVKYSPSGSTVHLVAKLDQKSVQFAVSDSGPGIASKDIPLIFERFYRADSSRAKQQSGGYGLGLPIAKSIAEAHGGTITVASKPGKGSTFTLTVPQA